MPAVPAAIAAGRAIGGQSPRRACVHRGRLRACRRNDRHGRFGLQRRAARVDQPPARRKQRPRRAQQLQLPGRERRDVFRPAQQLDVRMPPDHAGRRARHVEQDPLEGPAVPPAGGLARVAGHQRRRQSQSVQVVGDSRQALGRDIDRDQLAQVQAAAPAGDRSCRRAPRRHPERARRAAARPDRAPSCAAASWIDTSPSANPGRSATSTASCEQQRLVVVHAVRDCDAARREARPILRTSRAPSIDAHPERRTLIVRSENRLGLLAPVGRERIDEPARMRGAHGDIAIDLRAELRVLALAAAQERVDEAGGARVPEVTRRLDSFGYGGVRGNLRVQQLAQPDDRERAHVGIELLTGTREQALEQRIEPQVPANAVVRERTDQAALLARSSRRRSPALRRANGRASLRPQRSSPHRHELQPSGSRSQYRAVQTMRVEELRGGHRLAAGALHSRQTQHAVACADVDARSAGTRALCRALGDATNRWALPPTRAAADHSSASPRPATDRTRESGGRSPQRNATSRSLLPPCESSPRRSRLPPAARAASLCPAQSRRARRAALAHRALRGGRASSPRFRAHRSAPRASSSIGPVSRPASICMIVTPLSASPAAIAR